MSSKIILFNKKFERVFETEIDHYNPETHNTIKYNDKIYIMNLRDDEYIDTGIEILPYKEIDVWELP